MKRNYLLTALVIFLSLDAAAQTAATDSMRKMAEIKKEILNKGNNESIVFTKVENEASFPGGNVAWATYLQKTLSSFDPSKNGAPRGKYQVIAKFIVNKKGEISGVEAETDYGFGMESKVIALIKKSPKWKPAMQNGRAVNAYRRQPVTFIVE